MAAKKTSGTGPWWAENKNGDRFVWHVRSDIDDGDLTDTGEDPTDRNGGLRSPEPKNPATLADLSDIINEGVLQ
jgi:hypothetical protein